MKRFYRFYLTFYPIEGEPNAYRVIGSGPLEKLSQHKEAVKLSFQGYNSTVSACLSNYKNLANVEFDDALIVIDNFLLSSTQIVTFNIPKNVKKLVGNPFDEGLPVQLISVDPENKFFVSKNGALYSRDMKILYSIFGGNGIEYFVVPNSVELIEVGGISKSNTLKIIIIPFICQNN